jgi:tRNA threonylcarbamoyl adenosine modification protein YeaZ
MRILALDAAMARCSAAVVVDGDVVAGRQVDAARGHAALLPTLVEAVLAEAASILAGLERAGLEPVGLDLLGLGPRLDLIAVTVGPGSFTGIRAGLALAHGIAVATGVPLVGVSVGEALADAFPHLGRRALWCAIDSRRGRIFLERDGAVAAMAIDQLPRPEGPVAVAGDAAPAVAARLAARDVDVMLTDARLPVARHIALVAQRRAAGELAPRAAQPLYVDPPEARLPAAGLRPTPVA